MYFNHSIRHPSDIRQYLFFQALIPFRQQSQLQPQ